MQQIKQQKMNLDYKNISNSLTKAYLVQNPAIDEINKFKENYIEFIKSIKPTDNEETLKDYLNNFLRDTYYKGKFQIKENHNNIDLVILNGKNVDDKIGVIVETKAIKSNEMITTNDLNKKAFHEIVQYYLEERIINENLEIKHLIITNSIDWFIFNATEFERLFYQNKSFLKKYNDWYNEQLVSKNKDWFYSEIAKPFIETSEETIVCTHFQLCQSFETLAKFTDEQWIELYKVFSPENLLKLPFQNDSNTLNREFYDELLHILGLYETKDNTRKIERLKKQDRNEGSLLENVISIIETDEIIPQLKNLSDFENLEGLDDEELKFSIALELSITWLNRILFLKLLEGQLLKYNNNNQEFTFLNNKKIKDFEDLKELFFEILAVKPEDRKITIKEKYERVPFLNSSLFELTQLEKEAVKINHLKQHTTLPIYSSTVLKDDFGKRKHGQLTVLQYLFEFLDSFNFASDNVGTQGHAHIQQQNKTIINSSVLGLIFEKLNGYKEGSFFTPGYITMYVCQETIRKAVIQKFNSVYNWKCESITDIRNKIIQHDVNLFHANQTFNSIRICDPAVGSGHFLVSALNELIAIKSELRILMDTEGSILPNTYCEVENDELLIEYKGKYFQYNYTDKESRQIQETIFKEKRTLIENCLFGVDINPKSVQICRLRLWIKLLKNAFYRVETLHTTSLHELETLPNIDINIKTGNSLVSFYKLNGNGISKMLPNNKKHFAKEYREKVAEYKESKTKKEKQVLEKFILDCKDNFKRTVNPADEDYKKIQELETEIGSTPLFFNHEEQIQWKIKYERLNKEKAELEKRYEEKRKEIYYNSFEWRFEFPEVLDDDGYFVGFDVVIGNPPYIRHEQIKKFKPYFQKQYKVYNGVADLLTYFIELSYNILKKQGQFCFIISEKFTRADYGKELRKFLLQNCTIDTIIDFAGYKVFDSATVDTLIISFQKEISKSKFVNYCNIKEDFETKKMLKYIEENEKQIPIKNLTEQSFIFEDAKIMQIRKKIETIGKPLKDWNIQISRGIITGLNEAFIIDEATKNKLISKDKKNQELLKPILRGRDIFRYYPKYQNLYLINSHNGIKDKKIKNIDVIKDYPIIYNYLKPFEQKATKRLDQGNHWTNLRDCAYWQDFEKPKLIYKDIAQELSFTYDDTGYYLLNTAYFINADDFNFYLLGILNSKLIDWYYRNISVQLGQKGIRHFTIYIEQIPVKVPTEKEKTQIEKLVKQILNIKKIDINADIQEFENKINSLVYKMYKINDKINLIENL